MYIGNCWFWIHSTHFTANLFYRNKYITSLTFNIETQRKHCIHIHMSGVGEMPKHVIVYFGEIYFCFVANNLLNTKRNAFVLVAFMCRQWCCSYVYLIVEIQNVAKYDNNDIGCIMFKTSKTVYLYMHCISDHL